MLTVSGDRSRPVRVNRCADGVSYAGITVIEVGADRSDALFVDKFCSRDRN